MLGTSNELLEVEAAIEAFWIFPLSIPKGVSQLILGTGKKEYMFKDGAS